MENTLSQAVIKNKPSHSFTQMCTSEWKNFTALLIHPYLQYIHVFLQSLPVESRFLQSRNLNCVALCEGKRHPQRPFNIIENKSILYFIHTVFLVECTVITSKDLQKHGNIWVCPVPDHVCTRFFFVWVIKLDFLLLLIQTTHCSQTLTITMCMLYRYEDGQVGDANINTQEARIQREIVRVIGSQSS